MEAIESVTASTLAIFENSIYRKSKKSFYDIPKTRTYDGKLTGYGSHSSFPSHPLSRKIYYSIINCKRNANDTKMGNENVAYAV